MEYITLYFKIKVVCFILGLIIAAIAFFAALLSD